jgi:hypothetical protein
MAPFRGDFLTIAAGAAFSVAAFLLVFLGVSPTAVFATAARLDRVKVSIVYKREYLGVPWYKTSLTRRLKKVLARSIDGRTVNSGQVPCAGPCSTFGAV